MVQVLVIGYAPDAVDFSDPAIPPGLDEARVAEGIKADLQKMHEHGWEAEHLPIRAAENLNQRIADHVRGRSYDCIVIGAGVRMTTKHIPEFEQVVEAVRRSAPQTPVAFNAGPDSSDQAVLRWLARD